MLQFPNHLDRGVGFVEEEIFGGAEEDEWRSGVFDALLQARKKEDRAGAVPEVNVILAGCAVLRGADLTFPVEPGSADRVVFVAGGGGKSFSSFRKVTKWRQAFR